MRQMVLALRAGMALMLAMMVVLPATVRGAMAQSSTDAAYEVELTGDEVTWDGDWELNTSGSGVNATNEIVYLDSDSASVQLIYIDPDNDLEATIDQWVGSVSDILDDFEVIDQDAGRRDGYVLAEASDAGTDFGIYLRADVTSDAIVASLLIAESDDFADTLEDAQENVAINGDAIFPDEDANDLQDLLDDHESGDGRVDDDDATPTEEATEEVDDDVVVNDDDDKKLDEDEDDPDVDEDTTPESDADLEDLGLVDEGEYQSPQFDTAITWTDDWEISTFTDDPLTSDENAELDTLELAAAGSSLYAVADIRIFPADDQTIDSVVDYWTSDDFLETDGDAPYEVLYSDTSRREATVVISNGDDLIEAMWVYFPRNSDLAIVIDFYTDGDSFEDGLASAQEAIEIDGNPVLELVDVDAVLDAYDEL